MSNRSIYYDANSEFFSSTSRYCYGFGVRSPLTLINVEWLVCVCVCMCVCVELWSVECGV